MYPKQVKLFVPWAKAMVQGATVDKPNYGKTMRKRRKKRRRKHAKTKEA